MADRSGLKLFVGVGVGDAVLDAASGREAISRVFREAHLDSEVIMSETKDSKAGE